MLQVDAEPVYGSYIVIFFRWVARNFFISKYPLSHVRSDEDFHSLL